jgi:hypothetical protein
MSEFQWWEIIIDAICGVASVLLKLLPLTGSNATGPSGKRKRRKKRTLAKSK